MQLRGIRFQRRPLWQAGVLVMGLLLAAVPAVAQDSRDSLKIVERLWGFDGRVQPGQFNPLSILVDNLSDEPVEAVALLQEATGVLADSGGRHVQPVYVAPRTRRWIQFYPYIGSVYQSTWRLRIGRQTFEPLIQPRAAFTTDTDDQPQAPQAVILDPPEFQSGQPRSIKHFPEQIFPPYSTVTFGLHTVFLDHVPDWEQPRQQAFMTWLRLGGRVHILKDRRNSYPQFSGELAELSQPFDNFRVGQGSVTRHDLQRAQLSSEIVRAALSSEFLIDSAQAQAEASQQMQPQLGNNMLESNVNPAFQDDEIFRTMRMITQPQHAWWLIFLLALTYIGMVFPGCWMLAQRKNLHFLATYGMIAGLSVAFSFLFLLIGRRGYGEATTLHTLAIARMEDATHASLFQWNALFVTSGDSYIAGGPDQESVYATATGERRVPVNFIAGNAGRIEMEIPPFSAQTFLSRRRVIMPKWDLQIRNVTAEAAGLRELTISTGQNFAPPPEALFRVIAGSRIYRLAYDPAARQLALVGTISRVDQFVREGYEETFAFGPFSSVRTGDDKRTEEQRFYEESLPDLVRRSLLDDLVYDPARFKLPDDRVRLLIYMPVPEPLHVPTETEARRVGQLLVVQDLFLDSTAAATPD